MEREDFKDLTGEDPEDMFGLDWENEVMELGLTEEDVRANEQDDYRDYINQEVEAMKTN